VQLVDLPPLVAGGTPAWIRPIVRQADLLLLVLDLADDPLTDLETCQGELAAMRVEPVASAPPASPDAWVVQKATLVVGNKRDLPGAADVYELVVEACAGQWPTLAVSAAHGEGLEELRREVFRRLDVVRVYTRAPGQAPDRTRPFVLRRGETVEALAEAIHKDWRDRLRYAQVWGSGKFQGQRVGRHYAPADGDVVELVVAD
jgi:ribosome-interacting GTPase 1